MAFIITENCTGCTFSTIARQIRIHDSSSCDFYLRVRSRPIMEHCSKLANSFVVPLKPLRLVRR